ncbi:MAG: peptidylprolyl isomerase [Nocardioides sp.]
MARSTLTRPLPRPPYRRPLLAVAVAALLPVLVACGGGSSSTTGGSPASPDQGSSGSGVSCNYPDAPQGKTGDATKPPSTPDVSGKVAVTMQTNVGAIAATLDADKAPCTVNSFVSLAKQGYFDNSPCHRLTTIQIYVLQCGDPTGTGTGGPGYTIPDELSPQDTYGPGTVAMAKTQAPNSGGSQFFLVYRSSPLPPDYTVFGQLDRAGLKILKQVAKQGSDNATAQGDGHPRQAVTIQSVSVG